jgi:hypothetical protein
VALICGSYSGTVVPHPTAGISPAKVIFVEISIIMNIQERKPELIKLFLYINDDSLIIKLESFLKNESVTYYADKLKPISWDD